MTMITLLTDFGMKDGFSGVMHGVILGIAPNIQIVDITHAITPQNILEGSLVLAHSAPYFPPGTIHVSVVDPGVGTARRPIAARLGGHTFIGPDNGLFTGVIELAEAAGQKTEFYHLNRAEYWLPIVSRSFHGRDIFAPVAAHLALGKSLTQMGEAIHDPARIIIPQPEPTAEGWAGQVLAVDHFGNLITNFTVAQLHKGQKTILQVGEVKVVDLVQTFGDRDPGSLVALVDSSGALSIAVVNGNAAERLRAGVGTSISLKYSQESIH